jgi:hypothetical protein
LTQRVVQLSTVTPDYGMICETTLVFYFVILPSVSPIAVVIMYHLLPTPESYLVYSHCVFLGKRNQVFSVIVLSKMCLLTPSSTLIKFAVLLDDSQVEIHNLNPNTETHCGHVY